MNHAILAKMTALALSCCAFGVAYAKDVEGSSDNPLIGRFAGATLDRFSQTAFDETKLLTGQLPHGDDKKLNPVWKEFTGKNTNIRYTIPENSNSALEVISALKENMAAKNVEILFDCKQDACLNDPLIFQMIPKASENTRFSRRRS